MSHLRPSIQTMSNQDLIREKRDLTILHNIKNNCNNNYKISCCDELKYAASYDLYMSAVKGESMVNIMNQDIKHITTNTDEFPYNYVLCSNDVRDEIILRTPCCKPLTVDKNYKKNGKFKKSCNSYNQCVEHSFCVRDKCVCNNNQRVLQKLSSPKLCLNTRLVLSNNCG